VVEAHADVPDETPELIEQLANQQRLEKILEQVPANYRRVLLMSKCDGLSNEEIAKSLGVTVDSVVRYLGRAMAFARRARWE
jgi:RNA polymerase sigma factor (sigma-70 family)